MEPLIGAYSGELTRFDVLLIAGIFLLWMLERAKHVGKRAFEAVQRRLNPTPSAAEAARREYQNGDISLDELERRLNDALDERASVVRDRLEAVDGVGPARAGEIAEHFGNIDAVRRADRTDLEQVEGVGPEIAEKIRANF